MQQGGCSRGAAPGGLHQGGCSASGLQRLACFILAPGRASSSSAVAALSTCLPSQGKPLVISEFGFGAGNADSSGPTTDVNYAFSHPFFGTWGYSWDKDPFKHPPISAARCGAAFSHRAASSARLSTPRNLSHHQNRPYPAPAGSIPTPTR